MINVFVCVAGMVVVVLLSSPLLRKNISQSRLVVLQKKTPQKTGDVKTFHGNERGKFRLTDHNKQSQEVGSRSTTQPPCVAFKTAGKYQGLWGVQGGREGGKGGGGWPNTHT